MLNRITGLRTDLFLARRFKTFECVNLWTSPFTNSVTFLIAGLCGLNSYSLINSSVFYTCQRSHRDQYGVPWAHNHAKQAEGRDRQGFKKTYDVQTFPLWWLLVSKAILYTVFPHSKNMLRLMYCSMCQCYHTSTSALDSEVTTSTATAIMSFGITKLAMTNSGNNENV